MTLLKILDTVLLTKNFALRFFLLKLFGLIVNAPLFGSLKESTEQSVPHLIGQMEKRDITLYKF